MATSSKKPENTAQNASTNTHFGFKTVEESRKEKLVGDVFSNVAKRYDLMNDIMSFGLHHLWKDSLMCQLRPFAGNHLLDVASGTLDIARHFLKNGGQHVTAADINQDMLDEGLQKLRASNFKDFNQLDLVCCNAESLPFEDDMFDYYTISFGIRNVTHIDVALAEAFRVLKPGGKFVCLEFSNVDNFALSKINDFYLFNIIPKIGKVVVNDRDSYQYLAESIKKFPKSYIFEQMIKNAGFSNTKHTKMTFGVVALHVGYKL